MINEVSSIVHKDAINIWHVLKLIHTSSHPSAVKLLHAVPPISQHGIEVHKSLLSKGVMYLNSVTWMFHLWT